MTLTSLPNRTALGAVAVLGLLACGTSSRVAAQPGGPFPIVFVHGSGDSAAVWTALIWQFESNGWDRSQLVAVDLTAPGARRDDAVPEENRSSTIDQASELAAAVTRTLLTTGAKKVALVGSSRGGNTIRNYLRNAGGAVNVSHAVLCGTPNHGVWAFAARDPGSEFNGAGSFLKQLNEGYEVVPGVSFLTIRSDKNDKYAQPIAAALGMPLLPTLVGHDSPELKGARNAVIENLDHREVAFHPKAFAVMYEFLTGRPPAQRTIATESSPQLDGMVCEFRNRGATNRPKAGVKISVYVLDPLTGDRVGSPVHQKETGEDGRWGPFAAKSDAYYEFEADNHSGTIYHFYRTPFPRGSRYVNLRLPDLKADGSVVTLYRPRGYLGKGRDRFLIDGSEPDKVPAGVPTSDNATKQIPASPRAVAVQFNDEKFVVRTRASGSPHYVVAEAHYD